MKRAAAFVLLLAGCATDMFNVSDFEAATSLKPQKAVRDCLIETTLRRFGPMTSNDAGGKTFLHNAIEGVTTMRLVVQAENGGTTIFFRSIGLAHVQLREAVESCR